MWIIEQMNVNMCRLIHCPCVCVCVVIYANVISWIAGFRSPCICFSFIFGDRTVLSSVHKMNVWIMNIMEQYRWTVACIFHYESRLSSILWTLNQIRHPFLIFVTNRLDEQPSSGWRPQLSTLQFQMLLQNLTTLKIRATFGQGYFFLEYNFLLLSLFWKIKL